MNKHIVELASVSQQHILTLLLSLVGYFCAKKSSRLFAETNIPGDNIPTTLIEGRAR
jgi:hypothetical protein